MVKAILEIEVEDIEEVIDEEDWDDLPEELRSLLEAGIKESEEGGGMPYEQFKEKYSQWFKK